MLRQHNARLALLAAAIPACLALTACGGDDDDARPATTDAPAASIADTAPEAAGGSSNESDASGDGKDFAAGGTVSVAGVHYSFDPSLCLPDGNGSSISGSGVADDGGQVYVDMAGGNLSIYVGTDDPFSTDPDYVANSLAGQGALNETIDGSTVSVEASFTAHAATEVIAEGSLAVTC